MTDENNDDAPTLPMRLAAIDKLESEIIRKAAERVPAGSPMYHGHFFIFGIIKRTLSQATGFRMLIEAKNFQCAAGILRMQIDSAMRLHALTLVADQADFCREWFSGTPIDKLKDAKGERLRDHHLRRQLAEEHPWIEEVYKDASNFIHFSGRHFFTSIVKTDDDARIVNFAIAAEDPPKPDSEYYEIVDAFFEATKLVGTLAIAYLYVLAGEEPH